MNRPLVRCAAARDRMASTAVATATIPVATVMLAAATVVAVVAVVVAVVAAATVQPVAAQAPDRVRPPPMLPAPALKLPAIQKLRLSNGLPVWIAELHEVPVAQVNLLIANGSAVDPVGHYGIASLAGAMLEEGAGSRTGLEIADAVDFLGASLNVTSGVDSTAVRLHVPVARLADAVPIMADVALRPTFPPDELERLRQERLTDLLQARDDPGTVAALAFARVLFGNTHRFGTATMGTPATIKGFSTTDLRVFYASIFRPDNATLLVVGDVKADLVMAILESAFGTWKAPVVAPAAMTLPTVPARATREVFFIDQPGAPQTQIRIGTVGVARSTPDFFPIQVLNTVLGGAFSSRLNLNLREKHGYTYGASSSFDMRQTPGPFSSGAGVQTDKTAEALQEFFVELKGILEPIPDDELTRAKNFIALRYPGSFETTSDISRRLEDAIVYTLPDDYFTSYVQNIQRVTAADVQRVAKKYIQPDKLAVVVVGDRATIESKIQALKLGRVTPLSIDDLFGTSPASASSGRAR